MNTYKNCALLILAMLFTGLTVQAGGPGAKEVSVDGIKVIYKKTPKDVISVRIFIRGGNATVPADKQGLEHFAFSLAAESGTQKRNKDQFSMACEKTGTEISGSSTYDYGTMNLNCIHANWEVAWGLFSEAVMLPAFDEKEFALMKGTLVTAAKQRQADPDQHLNNIAMEKVFE